LEKERTMSDVQMQVQKAIDELVESGAERGVQVAAYRRGELAVDAVAGIADPSTGRNRAGLPPPADSLPSGRWQ
jgi:hypothetical protein